MYGCRTRCGTCDALSFPPYPRFCCQQALDRDGFIALTAAKAEAPRVSRQPESSSSSSSSFQPPLATLVSAAASSASPSASAVTVSGFLSPSPALGFHLLSKAFDEEGYVDVFARPPAHQGTRWNTRGRNYRLFSTPCPLLEPCCPCFRRLTRVFFCSRRAPALLMFRGESLDTYSTNFGVGRSHTKLGSILDVPFLPPVFRCACLFSCPICVTRRPRQCNIARWQLVIGWLFPKAVEGFYRRVQGHRGSGGEGMCVCLCVGVCVRHTNKVNAGRVHSTLFHTCLYCFVGFADVITWNYATTAV